MGYWDEEYIDCNSSFCFWRCSRCKFRHYYVCDRCIACKKCIEHKLPPEKIDEKGCEHTTDKRCSCTEEQIKKFIEQQELEKQLKEQEEARKLQLYLDQNTFRLQDIVNKPWYGQPQNMLDKMAFRGRGVYRKFSEDKRTIKITPPYSKYHFWANTSLFTSPLNNTTDSLIPDKEYIFELTIKSTYTRDGTDTEVFILSARESKGENIDHIDALTGDLNITAIHKTDHKKLFFIEANWVGDENEKYYIRYFKERGKRPKPGINRFIFGFMNTKQDILNMGCGYQRTNHPNNKWLLCINALHVYNPTKED